MPFNHHLKNALFKKGGIISKDQNSVSFYKGNNVLTFYGSDEREMVEGLDGVKHERVRIKYNDEELNLGRWLNDETPILMTGKRVIKNKNGTPIDCHKICYEILIHYGF